MQHFTSQDNGAPSSAFTRHVDFCDKPDFSNVQRFDWVMSIEVGEHLPEACIVNYLALINASATHGVVLSWGMDQRGRIHISPLSPKSVARRMLPFGLVLHDQLSTLVRSHALLPWLLNDARVYLRNVSESLQVRLSNATGGRPWPWRRSEIVPWECRTRGDRCGSGACKPKYKRENCVSMADRCPCSFAVTVPTESDPVLEARLSRARPRRTAVMADSD